MMYWSTDLAQRFKVRREISNAAERIKKPIRRLSVYPSPHEHRSANVTAKGDGMLEYGELSPWISDADVIRKPR